MHWIDKCRIIFQLNVLQYCNAYKYASNIKHNYFIVDPSKKDQTFNELNVQCEKFTEKKFPSFR